MILFNSSTAVGFIAQAHKKHTYYEDAGFDTKNKAMR